LHVACRQRKLVQRQADDVIGIAAEAADADLFPSELFGIANSAYGNEGVGQEIDHPANDLDLSSL
jgi:hypothetical protein